MKTLIFILIFLLTCFSGISQIRLNKNVQERKDIKIERNLALEKQTFDRSSHIANFLSSDVKEKLGGIARQLVISLADENTRLDIDAFVTNKIHRLFPRLTTEQTNLLKFYVMAKAAEMISNKENEGMGELSEMMSLRLQMAMDRRSKFISTLSQIMKKISTTQDMLVQNLK